MIRIGDQIRIWRRRNQLLIQYQIKKLCALLAAEGVRSDFLLGVMARSAAQCYAGSVLLFRRQARLSQKRWEEIGQAAAEDAMDPYRDRPDIDPDDWMFLLANPWNEIGDLRRS